MAQQNGNKMPAEQQKAQNIKSFLNQGSVKRELANAVPKHLTVDRLLRVAMTAIRTNPKLLECDQQSLLACVMGCAQLGLEPEPFLGQAYLVPFWNGKKGHYEATLIPGYRGYISLARRSGEVKSVSAHVVYDNDYFELKYGLDENLEHIPTEGERGEPRGAYVIFRYKDGSYSFDYMTADEIERIRNKSKAKDSGPWVTDWAEMAKKTVIRRHIKLVPLSVEMSQAAAAEDRLSAGESQMPLFGKDDGYIEAQYSESAGIEEQQDGALDEFEHLAGEAAKTKQHREKLDRFVQVTAEYQGVDPDEIKKQAVARWDQFWGAFEKWKKQSGGSQQGNQDQQQNTPPEQGTEQPAEEPTGGAQAESSTIECPDMDDRPISKQYCNETCQSRQGCPAWD